MRVDKAIRVAAFFSVTLAACSDVPTEPMRSTTIQAHTTGDTLITLTDTLDGLTYELNLNQRHVVRSDGEIMRLDDEQFLMAHATFAGIVASDPVAADLGRLGHVDCSTLPPDDPRCVEPQMVAPGGAEAMESSYSGSDPCRDIVDLGISRANEYRVHKWSWMRNAFGAAAAEVVNGVVYKFMPYGSAVAAAFAGEVANHYQNRIQMGFLAAVWNSNGCQSRTVTSSTIYRNGSSGTELEQLVCWDYPDRITFNGGETWFPVTVRVCEFRTT